MNSPASRNFSQRISRGTLAALAVIIFLALTAARPALAQNESIMYSFCALANCDDGMIPQGGLIMDSNGNLYGVAFNGGDYIPGGVVFKLSPEGEETILHNFGAIPNDGNQPQGALIMDKQNNLYGTTCTGGANDIGDGGGNGTVFKLSPDGTETILYNFGADNNDGSVPRAGVVMDSKGNLYGSTNEGGAYGAGIVFRVSPEGKETILHTFGSTGATDGVGPWASLVMDANENLYGTTYQGGLADEGTAFEISAKGEYSILHSFGATSTDGTFVNTSLTLDSHGDLYGTTYLGGTNNVGTVFKLTPTSSGTWRETILYNFTDYQNCYAPASGVLLGANGDMYGTTLVGGTGATFPLGCAYEINATGKLTNLHSFDGFPDGANPAGNLLRDSQGNLYGVTSSGGNDDYGVAFRIIP
jgi:uncharacterized repeat protein (TIGR03803 family)